MQNVAWVQITTLGLIGTYRQRLQGSDSSTTVTSTPPRATMFSISNLRPFDLMHYLQYEDMPCVESAANS
jgi:hypothetical protein